MEEEKNKTEDHQVLNNTDLAFERTMLAEERTLMAWIRTAISLISFGFTIYKFFQQMSDSSAPHKILSPRRVGMIMISFGLLGLFLAQIQHHIAIKKLKKSYPAIQKSLSSLMAILIFVFGLIMFLGVMLRQ